jgi:predicted lipoprotein with Yx(FWY)xxD motif
MTKRCNVCGIDYDGQANEACPNQSRHHIMPKARRDQEGKTADSSAPAPAATPARLVAAEPGSDPLQNLIENLLVSQSRLHKLLRDRKSQNEAFMDAVQTFAAAETVALQKIHDGVIAVDNALIDLQNSEGQLSTADQAALDNVLALSNANAALVANLPPMPGAPSQSSSGTSAAGGNSSAGFTAGLPSSSAVGSSGGSSSTAFNIPTYAGGVAVDPTGKTLYAFSGTGTPDSTVWPTAGVYFAGETLYVYSGDTTPGQTNGNGLGGVWSTVPDPNAGGSSSAAPSGSSSSFSSGLPSSSSSPGGASSGLPSSAAGAAGLSTSAGPGSAGSVATGLAGTPGATAGANVVIPPGPAKT